MCIAILLSYSISFSNQHHFPLNFTFEGGGGDGWFGLCKKGVGRQLTTFTLSMSKCCLFQWFFFSLAGRLCSGGLRFDWANLIFADFFIVSGWDDLPSDIGDKIFSDFFWNANLSLRLNKDFRSCSPKCLLDGINYKRFSFCPWMWRFPAMFSHYHCFSVFKRMLNSHE